MFVGDKVRLDVSFAVASERLARLGDNGALTGASEYAYGPGLTRVGVAGVSKLVRVQVRELSCTDQTAGLALRWVATGTGGALFPVLDADLTLTPAGEGTIMSVAGSYRPPLGAVGGVLDRAILRRVADGTIRSFLTQVAAKITGQLGSNGAGSAPPPEVKA